MARVGERGASPCCTGFVMMRLGMLTSVIVVQRRRGRRPRLLLLLGRNEMSGMERNGTRLEIGATGCVDRERDGKQS